MGDDTGAAVDEQRPESRSAAARTKLTLGLVAGPGVSRDLAERIAPRLRTILRERFPDTDWNIVARTEPLAGSAGIGADLVQLTRRRMLDEGWQLAVCLTEQPLNVGYRPVTAQASRTLGVGVISVPALGAIAVEQRAVDAIVRTIEPLLPADNTAKHDRDADKDVARLDDPDSPVGHAHAHDEGTIRFATTTARGNLRILVGKVRANRPWKFIVGLSRALVAALGTSAFGLTSPVLWRIADTMPFARLLAVALFSLVAIGVTIIVAHGLWERAPSRAARRQVVLVNLATAITVAIGVVTPYLGLLALNFAFGHVLIVAPVMRRELNHDVHVVDYVRVAWLVSSVATLAGALGAAFDKNSAVRDAAFNIRQTESRGHDRVGG